MTDLIALPQLPRVLRRLTNQPLPSYRVLYKAALDCAIPAEHRTGRWYIRRTDLDEILQVFSLERSAGGD